MSDIEELNQRLIELMKTLDEEQQMFLNLKSIRNFLLHYNKLTNYKNEVRNLLVEYFDVIRSENYFVDKSRSTELAFKYIDHIGNYYRIELGFRLHTDLSFSIFWGVIADILLLLFGVLKNLLHTFCYNIFNSLLFVCKRNV